MKEESSSKSTPSLWLSPDLNLTMNSVPGGSNEISSSSHGLDEMGVSKPQMNLVDLNHWTDFTNLGELDFSLLEEHFSMIQGPQLLLLQQLELLKSKHQFTEFSHTLFPPIGNDTINNDAHQGSDLGFDLQDIDTEHGQQSLVRTDLIFTPLVSPLVTPMDHGGQKHNYHHHHHHHHHQGSQDTTGMFSPLTSPLLEFQHMKSSPIIRIKKDPYDDPNSHFQRRKSAQMNKTPGSTPIVGPTVPGRVTKQSPVVKPKRHIGNKHFGDIKLPESSMDFKAPNSIPKRSKAIRESPEIDDQDHPLVTPATLMNFQLDHSNKEDQQVLLNTNRAHSNSSSPVILPSSTTPLMGPRRSSSISSKRKSGRNSSVSSTSTLLATNHGNGSSTSLNSRSQFEEHDPLEPRQDTSRQDTFDQQESHLDKKVNHKLAEQGRRNRMNLLIQNLDKLIPNDWKKDVLVPSKLTTIEIAIEYLKYLQNNQEHHNVSNTSDSISPLD